MVGPCEHGNEATGFTQYVEFLDELSSSKFVRASGTGRQLNATVWICVNRQQCVKHNKTLLCLLLYQGNMFRFL